MTTVTNARMRWMVRGDIDGFFGLALDNFVQLLLIVGLCSAVLGFSQELMLNHILPGAAISLLVGNLFYAWQAIRLGNKENRDDVCALPYGINTVSLFAFIFLVMLPVKLSAMGQGVSPNDAAIMAWQVGLAACFLSGIIEAAGAFVAQWIRKYTPRAALLSTLSGIALGFIAMAFFFQSFAHPIVGLTTFAVVILVYFGKLKFIGGIPGGLIAVLLGIALSFILGYAPTGNDWGAYFYNTGGYHFAPRISFHPPIPVLGDLIWGLDLAFSNYMSIIIPMGLFSLFGSIQNLESAEAEGDKFKEWPSLLTNGIGTCAAAVFGSCFPTTIYIGHPGWKQMGARAGYSSLNGVFFCVISFSGLMGALTFLVPTDAAMAIVLWIGIVITAQCFSASPKEHAPAAVLGIFPGVAAWVAIVVKAVMGMTLAIAGVEVMEITDWRSKAEQVFAQNGFWIEGIFALEQGFLMTSMIWAAIVVCVIDRKLYSAAIWAGIGAVLSAIGLMHAYTWPILNVSNLAIQPAWPFVIAYSTVALLMLIAPWITKYDPKAGH